MTTTLSAIVLETPDPPRAESLYAALELTDRIEVRSGDAPSRGFRGYTLSLVVSRPATVDAYVREATDAGAEVVKEPSKSLWGYGGSVQAPDGALWTIATSSKKDTGPATLEYDDLVLLLGVDDVKATKRFYAERGIPVSKGFGNRYVELETAGIKLAVQPRRAVAKNAGVGHEGSGSHRIVVVGDVGTFTDPDGYEWRDAASERGG